MTTAQSQELGLRGPSWIFSILLLEREGMLYVPSIFHEMSIYIIHDFKVSCCLWHFLVWDFLVRPYLRRRCRAGWKTAGPYVSWLQGTGWKGASLRRSWQETDKDKMRAGCKGGGCQTLFNLWISFSARHLAMSNVMHKCFHLFSTEITVQGVNGHVTFRWKIAQNRMLSLLDNGDNGAQKYGLF